MEKKTHKKMGETTTRHSSMSQLRNDFSLFIFLLRGEGVFFAFNMEKWQKEIFYTAN